MKICILSGSPHRRGNTMRLVESYAAGATGAGHEVELFDVPRLDIRPCMGCMACKKKQEGCIQHDDMTKVYESVLASGVLVFASPMYWWNMSGPLKTAIDRLFALPFNIRMGGRALVGKRLQMLVTCGQPASPELEAELGSMGRKMCAFTGMEWLGLLSGGNTGELPLAEQQDVLEKARQAGGPYAEAPHGAHRWARKTSGRSSCAGHLGAQLPGARPAFFQPRRPALPLPGPGLRPGIGPPSPEEPA